MIVWRRGRTIRSRIAKSRTIRSGRMRAGTLEVTGRINWALLQLLLCPKKCNNDPILSVQISMFLMLLLASERARSRSCSIEISDTYVYIYVCGRTSSYMRILNSSLLGHEKLRGPMVRNVGRVKFRPLSKA